jgi:hypothetical protein
MIVRVAGVKRVRAKGRNYYHRKIGRRINAEPNTAAFIAEVKRLDEAPRQIPDKQPGTGGALVAKYRLSPEYRQLAHRTRSDYEKVFDHLARLDRMPVAQMDGPFLIALRNQTFERRKRRFTNHVMQVLGTVMGWGKPASCRSGIRSVARSGSKSPGHAICRAQIGPGPRRNASPC